MRKVLMATVLMGGIVALGGGLSAQQPEPKKGGFGFDPKMMQIFAALRSSPASLLTNKSVREEIKLDEEQIKTLTEKTKERMGTDFKDRMAKTMEKAKALEGVADDKLDEKIQEVFKEEIETPMKDAEKVLKPDQLKRLKQIHIQNRGIALFNDHEYAAVLKITSEQKAKAKEIQTELTKDLRELGGGRPNGGRPMQPSKETMEKIANVQKEAKEKALDLLTADQKKTYKDMSGEPFEVKQEFGGGGNRPNRPTPKKKDD
ncbi:hypothetical protein [Zavarzinella formosa]|uniref:hypothetical protein n=1 Tax=Zavarzinella formosa TaxID=360055 RepID=UPI0002E6FA12|nr:hypothetical protein [Zavarzinella formosa]